MLPIFATFCKTHSTVASKIVLTDTMQNCLRVPRVGISGISNILNETLLDGQREIYNSLSAPIGPTISSIKILEEIIHVALRFDPTNDKSLINEPFGYSASNLGEQNIYKTIKVY